MADLVKLVKELRELTSAPMMDCKKALTETDGDIDAAIVWLRENGVTKAAKKASRVAAEGLCEIVSSGNTAILFELNSETDFVSKNDNFVDVVSNVGKALIAADASNDQEALEATLDGKKVEQILIDATATIGEKISLRRVQKVVKTDAQTFGIYRHAQGKNNIGGKIVTLVVLNGTNEEVATNISIHAAAMNPLYLNEKAIPQEVLDKEKEILKQTAINDGEDADKIDRIVEGRLKKYKVEISLLDQKFIMESKQTVEAYAKANNSEVACFVRLEVGEGIEKEVGDFAAEVAAQVAGV